MREAAAHHRTARRCSAIALRAATGCRHGCPGGQQQRVAIARRAGQRAGGDASPTSRPGSSTPRTPRGRVSRRCATANNDLGVHHPDRHARPVGVRARASHDSDPRRTHLHRGAAPHRDRRARARGRRRAGVRGARPRGAPADPARLPRDDSTCATGCGSPWSPTMSGCGRTPRAGTVRPGRWCAARCTAATNAIAAGQPRATSRAKHDRAPQRKPFSRQRSCGSRR